ncbi:MAG: HigA family addiction module antidote protein, partial [Acidobacteria bacterium]|nr:HigA family addiction module antidote protein [Acidobacteriota bacterium]
MARRGNRIIPARNIPPGTIIKDELEARGWTQEDLARIMGRPAQVISEIVSAKKQITPETALGLAAAFGTSAEMWLTMEAAYRLRLAQQRNVDDAVERRSRIYSLAPVKELVKRGWIPGATDMTDVDELERSVIAFFDVRSLDGVSDLTLAAHRTPTKEPDPRAVRAWMRRVEQLATEQEVGTFRRARLEKAIADMLLLSAEPSRVCEVPGIVRELGIRFVLVPHLPRTYLDGAVFAG